MEIRTVKEGAKLKCTFGIEQSELKVPDHRGVYMQGGNEAIVKDSIVGKNIFDFKYCKRILNPQEIVAKVRDPKTGAIIPVRICIPKVVLDWINGKKDSTLKGELALLNICIVSCLDGGIISIDEDGGQNNNEQ